MKKFLNKSKDKKGFTMVELIVVIVIILVLAAVLVPSLLKYIGKANEANVKNDAATALVQLQADYASHLADGTALPATVAGVTLTKVSGAGEVAAGDVTNAGVAYYQTKDDEISSFGYRNSKYVAIWTNAGTTGAAGEATGWVITPYSNSAP